MLTLAYQIGLALGLATATGGRLWSGIGRWLLMAIGFSIIFGVAWSFCDKYPNRCTLRCFLSLFQDPACKTTLLEPLVDSIVSVDNNPTSQTEVNYEIRFNQSVIGVDVDDFEIVTGGGISGEKISSIKGSGSTWTVTINTGTGNGTIQLTLKDNDSIKNSDEMPLVGVNKADGSFIGPTYEITKPSPAPVPSVSSLNRVATNPTSQTEVEYEIQFSQDVTGVDPDDFQIVTNGSISGARISSIQGNGGTRRITVNTGTGNGIIRIDLRDNDSIRNIEGSSLGGPGEENGSFVGQTYVVAKDSDFDDCVKKKCMW